VLRYHDADGWTDSVCRLGLRGPGPIEQSPIGDEPAEPAEPAETAEPGEPVEPADPEIAALPKPPRFPFAHDPDVGPKVGWWADPDVGIRKANHMRYYDGSQWTDFVCELSLRGPGEIYRKPRPPGHR
jgi:hypothetical protein